MHSIAAVAPMQARVHLHWRRTKEIRGPDFIHSSQWLIRDRPFRNFIGLRSRDWRILFYVRNVVERNLKLLSSERVGQVHGGAGRAPSFQCQSGVVDSIVRVSLWQIAMKIWEHIYPVAAYVLYRSKKVFALAK